MCYKLQKMPECDCLSIQHHNVEPILRVPRYELLLQDTLHLVSKAAKHSNEAMERNEKFQKLLNIYQRLSGVNMDFISPTRDFVKEGPITKISARSGEKQSRYLFLFSDLLLICTGTLVGTYKVRNELSVDGMKIKQGDNPNIPGSVVVHSKQKVIEILDENFALGDPGWYDALTYVTQEYRNRSFRNESEYHGSLPEREMLGKQAPRWIPDDASPCCMACQKTFTAIFRRHHCRSCGKLICKDCSRKAPLAYKYYKSARVCIHCRDVITSSCQDKTPIMDRKQWKDNLQGESYKSLTQKGQEVKHTQRTFSKLPEVPKPFPVKSSEASASSLCTPYTNDEPSPTDVTSGTTFARDQSCASSDCLSSDRCHICGISADEGNYMDVSFDNYADAGAYENVSFDNSQECDDMNLSDASWSDTENEFSEYSDDPDDALAVIHIEPTGQIIAPRDKMYMTAKELLDTERTYVQRLATLHQEFYLRLDRENRQRAFLPSDVLNQMFSSVPCIHRFHQDFLLPELELRMQNWDSVKKIGDLLKKNAPCLKMYTDYIKNYNNAMHLISLWLDKSPRFAAIIQEIQQMPECGNLTLQHLMLELKLRVSQYQHLLKDYLKCLPDDSPDRQDAQDALEIITQAVCHYNKAVKRNEKFIKLLDIYQRLLGVGMDFISPTRDYVKEGPVTQISALGGEKQPRYLILFNDLLLICVEPSVGVYEVVLSFNMEKMEIKEGDKANFPGTFVVQSGEKVIELLDESSTGDNPGWYEVLRNVMQEYEDSSQSLENESQPQETNAGQELLYYKEAPCYIPDSAVTSCRTCQQTFSPFRRRHHCPLCGMSICKGCSKKAPLANMDHRMKRVCVPCHDDIVHARLCQN